MPKFNSCLFLVLVNRGTLQGRLEIYIMPEPKTNTLKKFILIGFYVGLLTGFAKIAEAEGPTFEQTVNYINEKISTLTDRGGSFKVLPTGQLVITQKMYLRGSRTKLDTVQKVFFNQLKNEFSISEDLNIQCKNKDSCTEKFYRYTQTTYPESGSRTKGYLSIALYTNQSYAPKVGKAFIHLLDLMRKDPRFMNKELF